MDLKSDQITDIDVLDRKKFSKDIASNIINYLKGNNESLVIGIHGQWGSGKSTLLHFIKDEIRNNIDANTDDKKTEFLKILEFNPWMFSGKEELQTIFLNELALKTGSKKQKIRRTIKSLSKRLNFIGDVTKIGSATKDVIDSFADISIDALKEETNHLLIKSSIRVLVIMDDLDRLAPNEILEIFQLIKLNANFKNVLFLISFDKSVVINSIESQYKYDGEKYLEKIVQIDYSLPSILPEDIESIFFERLQKLFDLYKIDFQIKDIYIAWLIEGLKYFFSSIRDINRYFNSINFRLPSIHKDVDIHDFLIIEAVRLFDFGSYDLIRTSFKESIQFGNDSHFAQDLDKIRLSKSKLLFNYLFSKENRNHRNGKYRIFDPEFFDRYFALSISKKDMRDEELSQFIEYSKTRLNLLESVIDNDKIDFLLRRLATKSVLPQEIDCKALISPLIFVWDQYPDQFVAHWRGVWDAIKEIISTLEPEKGFRILIEEISISRQNFSPAQFLLNWILLQRILPEEESWDKDLDLYFDLIKSKEQVLEKNFRYLLDRYRAHFFNDSLDNFYARIFMPSYAKYFDTGYKELFKHLILDDRIFNILNMMVLRDSSTSHPFSIDIKYVKTLLPNDLKDDFKEQLRKINPKTISKEDNNTIELFLNYLEGN
jgi:hypothetical protein